MGAEYLKDRVMICVKLGAETGNYQLSRTCIGGTTQFRSETSLATQLSINFVSVLTLRARTMATGELSGLAML